MSDDERMASEAVPLEPGRQWDKPSGAHVGRGAALRVPVSEGPATTTLDRGVESDRVLMDREPHAQPLTAMEEGDQTNPRLTDLDRPVRSLENEIEW